MKHIKHLYILANEFKKKLDNDSVAAYSAQAAFFVIIAFFPFLMLFLTLLNYLPFTIEELEKFSLDIISPAVSGYVTSLFYEIYDKASGAVVSVTTITALWSASRGVLVIVKGLNTVYGAEEKRGFIRLRLTMVFYVLAFILTLIITLGFLVFGGSIADWLSGASPVTMRLIASILKLRWVVSVLVLVLFFMFLYSIVPDRKTKFKSELPGAVISAVGWVLFSALYSYYVENWSNYSYLYGSLTTIVLLMIWLYFCMHILFFGAEVNDFMRRDETQARLKNWHMEYQADKILGKKPKP